MNHQISLFASAFGVIFLAELPDKTAFASMLMATQSRPLPVFIGACLAFLVQSLVAIMAGGVFGLLPGSIVHQVSGGLFLVFAVLAWRRRQDPDDGRRGSPPSGFWRTVLASFVVIFIAEWGDLTQLATALLEARYHAPVLLFVAATLALWTVTGIAVILGSHLKRKVPMKLLNGIAATALALVGVGLLFGG